MEKSIPINPRPGIDIENRIFDEYVPLIGAYGFAVYVAILHYLNEQTNHCEASYATIARKLGMNQGAVIRHVKNLKRLKLLSPQLSFKEDGAGQPGAAKRLLRSTGHEEN